MARSGINTASPSWYRPARPFGFHRQPYSGLGAFGPSHRLVRVPELDRRRGAQPHFGRDVRLRQYRRLFHWLPVFADRPFGAWLSRHQMDREYRLGLYHRGADLHVLQRDRQVRRRDHDQSGQYRRYPGRAVLGRDDAVSGHLQHDDAECFGTIRESFAAMSAHSGRW